MLTILSRPWAGCVEMMSMTSFLSVTTMIGSDVIRTAKIWRTSNRDQWRDLVLALLFRMGLFNWEGEDKMMN